MNKEKIIEELALELAENCESGNMPKSYDIAEGFSEATRVLDLLPAEDVVPKNDFNVLNKMYREAEQKYFEAAVEMLDQAEQEFAKKIFEEIEQEAYKNEEGDLYLDLADYLKIKKKYKGE